jgi:hypothetical protein
VRLALYVFKKNICDGVGCEDESNDTPLDPPLFWLDNIFNEVKLLIRNIRDSLKLIFHSYHMKHVDYMYILYILRICV